MSTDKKQKPAKEELRLNAAHPTGVAKPEEEGKKGAIPFPDESFETILTRIARVPKPDQ